MSTSIIGNEDKRKYFEQMIEDATLSHAYALDGVKGIGKSSMIRQVIKKLLCKDKLSENFFDKGSHPDYLYIEPENGKILSQNSQKIIEFLSMKPSMAEYKVVHIDDAEKMNLVLQNKLLKTIEEPNDTSVFFLVSSNYDLLIDTLKSRLIRISFSPLSSDEIKKYARENDIEYTDEIIVSSSGSIGKFIELTSGDKRAYEFNRLMKAMIDLDGEFIYYYLSDIISLEDRAGEFLNTLEIYYLSLIKHLTLDREGDAIIIAKKMGLRRLVKLTDLVTESRNRLVRKQNITLVMTYLIHGIKEIVDDACNRC